MPNTGTSDGAQMRARKSEIRLSDLPSHLQTRFINELTPCLYELFGINKAWEQPKLSDIQAIWRDVFPKEREISLLLAEGKVVLKLVRGSIFDFLIIRYFSSRLTIAFHNGGRGSGSMHWKPLRR